MFKLGVITDEISQNIEEAAALAAKHGFTCLEIRSVNGRGAFDITDEDLAEIKKAAEKYGEKVVAISSPVYKCNFEDEKELAKSTAGFERCAKMAADLDAKYVRTFDFFDSGVDMKTRAEVYGPIIELCKKYGVMALVEYDPSQHSNTAEKAAAFVRAIDSPYVKMVFDPGNGYFVTPDCKAYPYEYESVKDIARHIHIKDIAYEDGKPVGVRVGDGLPDYVGLFEALMRDGYEGCIMLETHYRKRSELSDEQLVRPGGFGFSEGGYDASEESMISINRLVEEAKGRING